MSKAAGINHTVDGGLEVADLEEVRGVTETLTVDDDAHRLDLVVDLSEKKMHELMMVDPWIIGNEKFVLKDILYVLTEAVRCQAKKAGFCRCTLNGIHELATRVPSIFIGTKQPIRPIWYRYTRSHPNNLGLK